MANYRRENEPHQQGNPGAYQQQQENARLAAELSQQLNLHQMMTPFEQQSLLDNPLFRPDVKAVVKEKVVSVEKGVGGLVKDLLGGK